MPKNHFIVIRATPEEQERLKKIARAEGCSTLTQFCRQRLFQSLSVEIKLNKIIDLLGQENLTTKQKKILKKTGVC